MVCERCGAAIEGQSRFCPRCGAPVVTRATPPGYRVGEMPEAGAQPRGAGGFAPTGYAAAPPGYAPVGYGSRLRRQARSLGVLWCVFAAYRVVSGLIGLIFFRAFVLRDGFVGWPFSWGTAGMSTGSGLAWLAPVILGGTVISAALAGFVGWSLLTRRPWGRVLAIVVAVLSLIKFPLGTALGIYTLVLLAPRASAAEWEQLTTPGVRGI